MTKSEAGLLVFLREFDDPQWLEWPQHYNRGAFLGTEDAQAEGELDGADLAKVNRALDELGYALVTGELLELDYAGPSRLPWHVERPSRWHRFFGTF